MRTIISTNQILLTSNKYFTRLLFPQLYKRFYATAKLDNFTNLKEQPRVNPVGIQYLSNSLNNQLFGNCNKVSKFTKEENDQLLQLAKLSLKNHGLLGKKTLITEPISFELPKLQGNSLDEHFQKLGHFMSEPYMSMAKNKFKENLPIPSKWIQSPGWTRYEPEKEPESVPFPLEPTIVFDTEVLYKISHFPTLATALSDKAWYSWCSPFICSKEETNFKHLIPLDTMSKEKLIIGHNVSYDRSKVLEEYNFQSPKAYYMDTRSLHIATTGLSSRQRPIFKMNERKKKQLKKQEENGKSVETATEPTDTDLAQDVLYDLQDNPWISVSSLNSLSDVAYHYCGLIMDKSARDFFASKDKIDIINNFQNLMTYCAKDVAATSKVFDAVFPIFLSKCPHPVSFAALKALNNCILPVDYQKWNNYIKSAEDLYQNSKVEIEEKIVQIINELVKLKDIAAVERDKIVQNDPWLRQLDWIISPIKLTKKGVPYKKQKKPGCPEWYKALFSNNEATVPNITIRTRIIPLLFKLSWEGFPVVWTAESGWCFPIPSDSYNTFVKKNYIMADEESLNLYRDEIGPDCTDILMRIPNPRDRNLKSSTLLGKSYMHFFENGTLTSESKLASEALKLNSAGSYWMSSRERIADQYVVRRKDFNTQFKFNGKTTKPSAYENLAAILPQLAPMGTVTRRAVEKTWLTASNAKKNRIGSELKAQITAPDGYCFVGADVDSEELWIASLVGDSVFNIHGGTPIGWMCLEGTKSEGTDLHSKTAALLGCSRNDAKIFNYGRIYGAGVKFAGELLRQFNPTLTEDEAKQTATHLYDNTKGKIKRSRIFKKYWYGGSESILFNKLEAIAEQETPMTPILGCSITSALLKENLQVSSFLPSRINWAIQSSGVDYLHLLCCSMNYLISKYGLNARLCITIHDEIRYLSSEEDKYKVAMALQISNIWTRSMFCEQMGINDLPQNCAFFSAIDIDKVLRKEVDMDCITPSNPNAIPPGETLNIIELLKKPEAQLIDKNNELDVSHFNFTPRVPVFAQYDKAYSKAFLQYFLKMQVQRDSKEISKLEREYIKKTTESQFAKDKEEYGLNDYLKDIQSGKKQKLRIMLPDTVLYNDEFLEQHVIAQKTDFTIAHPPSRPKMKSLEHAYSDNFDVTNIPTQPVDYFPDLHKRMMRNNTNTDQ